MTKLEHKVVLLGVGLFGKAFKRKLEAEKADALYFDLKPPADDSGVRGCELRHSVDRAGIVSRLGKGDIMVNATGITKVDDAEVSPLFEESLEMNGILPGQLAIDAKRKGVNFVHLSTGYVFDGINNGPYGEHAPVNPLNAYGRHKLLGERAVLEAGGVAVRLEGLFGSDGGNVVDAMLGRALSSEHEYKVPGVFDQVTSLTYTEDLADMVYGLVGRLDQGADVRGEVFHAANRCDFSRADLAAHIARWARDHKQVSAKSVRMSTAEFNAQGRGLEGKPIAERPNYSVLNVTKLETFLRTKFRDADDALEAYLATKLE